MSGYVAMARVDGGRVRALAWSGRAPLDVPPVDPVPALVADARRDVADEEISLAERWDRFRDQLAMTTFYLTDPESWR